jgi:hypothetical protein
MLVDMTTPHGTTKNTPAFFVQAGVAFGVSFLSALGGIFYLPLDVWQRGFLGMTVLFLVSSAFTLAKVVRDQQESTTVRVRLDEARLEKLMAEYDPYSSTAS